MLCVCLRTTRSKTASASRHALMPRGVDRTICRSCAEHHGVSAYACMLGRIGVGSGLLLAILGEREGCRWEQCGTQGYLGLALGHSVNGSSTTLLPRMDPSSIGVHVHRLSTMYSTDSAAQG